MSSDRNSMTVQEAGLALVRRLRDHGHESLWAGGCVRDRLLGNEPHDIDVATDALPNRVVELFTKTRKVGAQFGVVLVKQGPFWIEVATFRSERGYEDGRHPTHVEFTTAEQDAQRRDFTINGLFYDPIDDRVIDYVGGQQDLEAGVIRAIGEPAARFAEDHLRTLRAVRFATRFGFSIESATAAAIRRNAAKIDRISAERIHEELAKMLEHRRRAEAVQAICDLGLIDHLWPHASWPSERRALAIRALAALPESADFVLALTTLLHDHALGEVRRIGRDLRCSNDQVSDMTWLIRHVDDVEQAEILCLPVLKRLIAHPRFDDLLSLHKAVCTARGLPASSGDIARQRRNEIPPGQVSPAPFVTGEDLINLGLKPGPRFKEILEALYDEQLDNRVTSRDDAMKRMRELADTSSDGS